MSLLLISIILMIKLSKSKKRKTLNLHASSWTFGRTRAFPGEVVVRDIPVYEYEVEEIL